MAGVTAEGYVPESLGLIISRIQDRLEVISPGTDFSPESPDGQLISIFSSELILAWDDLQKTYNSYDPLVTFGHGLRNISMLTGTPYGVATRSSATIGLVGTATTVVPEGSLVSDADGNQYYTNAEAIIPADVAVIAVIAGPTPILAGTLVNLDSVVNGWDGITQVADGVQGNAPQTEAQYRNMRNRTVMRNTVTVLESMQARVLELGIPQVLINNNDTGSIAADGTPAHSIHVTVGEYGGITDDAIAQVIFDTKGLGLGTFGTTNTVVEDSQGNQHTVNFSKSLPVAVSVLLNVTYLDDDKAGATERIQNAIIEHINTLAVGEDVIWSRLFPIITPFAKAQINSLLIGPLGTEVAANMPISDAEYAAITVADVVVAVV